MMACYIPYVGSWIVEEAVGVIEAKCMSLTTYFWQYRFNHIALYMN